MTPDLALQSITAVRQIHAQGHTCTDGRWYNPRAGTRSRCQTLAHLDTAHEQVTRLRTQVHDAAHSDRHVDAVAAALTSTPLTELPEDVRTGWRHMARLAVEALAWSLANSTALTDRAAALHARIAP